MALAFETFLISIALTASMVMLLRRNSFSQWSLDQPNHRSLHVQPVPRIGGLAMLLAVAISLAVLRPNGLPVTPLLLAAGLALVSLLDDRAHLPVALRLCAHVAAATYIALGWTQIFPVFPTDNLANVLVVSPISPLTALGVILATCWMTNLFNFMDGANGMAGGMAFIGFGGYGIAAALGPAQGLPIVVFACAVSGAALGFLYFNFPIARVFMGDAGSVPLGFLAAVIGIQGSLMELWPWWFGPLVFSPFIVDASVTLLKRILRHEKIWLAHRDHYYQRLILSGWSHRKTVISYYFLMLGSTGSALAAQNSHLLYSITCCWVITYVSLLLYLEWRFYKHKKDKKEETPGAK
jgi:UDP-GlcNAc:undecaprenyl-phosphate/decaprenyl-phosphate GlcNAc-1-phosphate transferase